MYLTQSQKVSTEYDVLLLAQLTLNFTVNEYLESMSVQEVKKNMGKDYSPSSFKLISELVGRIKEASRTKRKNRIASKNKYEPVCCNNTGDAMNQVRTCIQKSYYIHRKPS